MKRIYFILIGLIVIVCLACGCTGYKAATDNTSLAIIADRENYTPLMSSTVGIGLTPAVSGTTDNSTVAFKWHTDQGYFLSWGPPDFKVNNNGTDVTAPAGKVYWSYSPDEMGKKKPAAHITLTMVDRASGRAISSTGITIGWESTDVARVLR